ncbi:hypothetical protein GV832_13870 [Rhodobacteraceae bacterium CYK-10]|uniref:Prepilin type IV endopeptidase peptidase domain-containing protein n=2 Tax=Stagnihabitans tardus TaxID=2699202 RepID=A0AAE4YC46_9RHOB|nr:hypothetical protein [Stagnihabitans tardus]
MPATSALIFLPFTLVIAIWVSWKDLSTMKIPNLAVLALGAVWLVIGPFVMPWSDWLWGFGFAAIAFVVGFITYLVMGVGAGDVKFATAMAPFFVQADLRFSLFLISACMIGGLACHRLAKAIPAVTAATPDWESWKRKRYMPFGLCLSGILVFYLLSEAMK